MTAGPFSLSPKRRRDLYRRTMGRKVWLALAMAALAGYLDYQRVLHGTSGKLVMLAVAICTLSAVKGIIAYIRQGRYRMRFFMDGDELILMYPNLKRIILNRNEFRRVSPDGGTLEFVMGAAPMDGLFDRKTTALTKAVLDWLLESEHSRDALHRSRDHRDAVALHRERGIFARIPRGRMHVYTQLVPVSILVLGLYSRFVELLYFDHMGMIRLGGMLSVLMFLVVEMAWRRAERRATILKAKQNRAKFEDNW
jgi:hypothetical protein